MMWRLWNKLFGWDYALVEYGLNFVCRRVQRGNGCEFVEAYGDIIVHGQSDRKWIPLTYKIDK